MTLRLTDPAVEFVPSYAEALREGFRMGVTDITPPEAIAAMEADPKAYIAELLTPPLPFVIMPDGSHNARVPSSKFWLVEGQRFIGEVSIRHHLNEKLESYGGHIGYGTRPSVWGQGYGKKILGLALIFCRASLGLEKVLITCDDSNRGSLGVIEGNGGVLWDIRPHPYTAGAKSRRYWVPTAS